MRRGGPSVAAEFWGAGEAPAELTERPIGKGRFFWSTAFQKIGNRAAPRAVRSAQWIWYPEGNPAVAAPPGIRYFRKTLTVEGEVKSAQPAMTADNEFTFLDRRRQAGGGDKHRNFTFNVASLC